LAKWLQAFSSTSCSILPFAGPLKEASVHFLTTVAGCSVAEAHHHIYQEKSAPIPGLLGVTGRIVMQRLGEAGRRMHPDLWVRKWEGKAQALLLVDRTVVCDDVRRPGEAAAVWRLGGELWRLTRLAAQENADPEVIADVSEGALDHWSFDRAFSGDDGLDALFDTVRAGLTKSPPLCLA
jgi:hypothetical protein